jgi:excisionase family DNA binding protein
MGELLGEKSGRFAGRFRRIDRRRLGRCHGQVMSLIAPSLVTDQAVPQLVTTQEAADFLRVDPRTIKRWAEDGRLKRVKLAPRSVRYRVDDLLNLINEDTR